MFEITNITSSLGKPSVIITHNGKTIEFNVDSLVSKRNKDEIDPKNQYVLLEAYLDYRGDKFKDGLIDMYIDMEEKLSYTIRNPEIDPMPYELFGKLIDYIDYEKILYFLQNVYGLKAPSNLADTFDNQIKTDGLGTREQTYLKNDYIELAAYVLVIKTILPPLAYYAFIKSSLLGINRKEYVLYEILNRHPISEIPPVKKLWDFINRLVEIGLKDGEQGAVIVIMRGIPREDFSDYLLALATFQKVAIGTIINDNISKNVVTRIYNFINNKLMTKGDVSNAIRGKRVGIDAEGGPGDKESALEVYRIPSVVPKNVEIELDWSVSDPGFVMHQLPITIDPNIVNDAMLFNRCFYETPVDETQIQLLGYMFKHIIDPRGLDYVSIDGIVSLLSVGFAYLWSIDMKFLALLLTSSSIQQDSEIAIVNSTSNRNRIPKEVKNELQKYYPHERVVNINETENMAEWAINELGNSIYKKRWMPNATKKYLDIGLNNDNNAMILPADIKIQICDLVLHIERNWNGHDTQ